MALTFNTNQTLISAADALTNFAFYRASGAGGTGGLVLSTDFFRQGTGSVSYRVQANWEAGILYDYYTANANTALDMTTTGRHLYLWFNHLNVAFLNTDANNGIYVIATSDAGTTGTPTNYSRWVIGGGPGSTVALTYPGGWTLVVLDMNKTPTNNVGSGATISSIRRLGIGVTSITGTVKTENLYLDAMWYGQANYRVTGDGTLVADWNDLIAHSVSAENGLLTDIGGVVFTSCGLQIGNGAQTATTTFDDATGRLFVFKRYIYRSSGGSVVDAVDYANLYSVTGAGAASFRTSITIGDVVGTGDARQGVLGGGFRSEDITNITWDMDFQTDKADLSLVSLSGLDIIGAKGGALFDNNAGGTECTLISVSFNNCGEVDPGATGDGAEMLNCVVIDPLGGTSANRGLRMNDVHNIKQISLITTGTPTTQHLIHLPDPGPYSVTFDAIKFFGSYTSGTIWQGEASANDADTITLSATNLANPDAAEFEETGTPAATVVVSNDVTVTVTCKDQQGVAVPNARVGIFRKSDNAVILTPTNTNGSGVVSTTFNYATDTDIYIRARKDTSRIAYYPEYGATTAVVHQDATQACTTAGSVVGVAQSFSAAISGTLTTGKMMIKKTGTPTGNATANIYAHSGTLGTSSIPTGSPLATSNTVDVSTLSTSYTTYTFTFSGANAISLTAGTNYVLTVEYSGGSPGNSLDVGYDSSAPTYNGNKATLTSGVWTPQSGDDCIFYVIAVAPRYLQIDTPGTITASGFTVTLALSDDTVSSPL